LRAVSGFHLRPRCGGRGDDGGGEQAGRDKARKGAVKKRTQLKTKLGGATAFTRHNETSGEFMAVKKPAAGKKAAKKFKGVRQEK
jgi:hypothetical protein